MDMEDEGYRWACWSCGLVFLPWERDPDDVDCPECGSRDVGPTDEDEEF